MDTSFTVRQAKEIMKCFDPPEIFDDEASDLEDNLEIHLISSDEETGLTSNEKYSKVEPQKKRQLSPDKEKHDTAKKIRLEHNQESLVENERLSSNEFGNNWSLTAPENISSTIDPYGAHGTPIGQATRIKTPLEAWSLFFNEEILNIILTHTNTEIEQKTGIKTGDETYHKKLDLEELKAFIGLLYFSGLQKVNHTDTRSLWSPYGMVLFRLTMSQNRFKFLLECLRFDNKLTRKKTDRISSIREIWEMFIANCRNNYESGSMCTINDQLIPFRGFCPIRFNLPTRCGMKIVTLNDAETNYLVNAIPYCGEIEKELYEDIPSYFVRKLSEPIYNTGRNIMCDKCFTSIPICEKMLKNYGLTMVGTIDKNDSSIPICLKSIPTDPDGVQFAYNDGKVLISCNDKGKRVYLLSTYSTNQIDEETGKPEILLLYNATKGSTDNFDKKCQDYSVTRRTNRWQMRFFYAMLDQANVNSVIIFNLIPTHEIMNRKDFILELSLSLIKPLLISRLSHSTLRRTLRNEIESFLEQSENLGDQEPHDLSGNNKMPKQKRCGYCPHSLDRKTNYLCLNCTTPMCKEHTAKICMKCSLKYSDR